jgi:hypothetical protein
LSLACVEVRKGLYNYFYLFQHDSGSLTQPDVYVNVDTLAPVDVIRNAFDSSGKYRLVDGPQLGRERQIDSNRSADDKPTYYWFGKSV